MTDLKLYYEEPGVLEVGVDEAGRGCEFEDALVLTDKGWKKYYEIDEANDLVLSYTSEHKMVWQSINKVLSWSIDEELIQMKHRYIDILVTKDHHFDVLVRKMRRNAKGSCEVIGYTVQRKKVTDLSDNDYLPRTGDWEKPDQEFFVLPEVYSHTKLRPALNINMDDWLAFFGLYLAEGCCGHLESDHSSYVVHISQKKIAEKAKIAELLAKLPFNFKSVYNGFLVHNKQLYRYLEPIGDCYTKYIPYFYKNLSTRQCNILLDWMIFGDGNVHEHGGNRKSEIRYYTSSKNLKNDFEELALKCGYGFGTIIKTKAGDERYIRGEKIYSTADNYQITLRRTKVSVLKNLLLHKELIHKKGTVFCLSLPEHHNFYIKRSGSGYFTGNSFLGDVFAGAVFWDPECKCSLINDSKKLNERKRLIAFDYIKENCLAWGIGRATAEEIDEINILNASIKAMHRAIDNCTVMPEHILVDGTQFKIYENKHEDAVPHTTVIDGDTLYYSVAAASILAKVGRDQYILDLVDEHPELDIYQLASNKGYGSAQHIKAIQNWGISPFHRKTFGICKKFA